MPIGFVATRDLREADHARSAFRPTTLQLPGGEITLDEGTVGPTHLSAGFVSWADLGVGDPWDMAEWRRASTGLMTTAQAAKELGVKGQALGRYIRIGRIRRPANIVDRGKNQPPAYRWTAEEVEAARAILEASAWSSRV